MRADVGYSDRTIRQSNPDLRLVKQQQGGGNLRCALDDSDDLVEWLVSF